MSPKFGQEAPKPPSREEQLKVLGKLETMAKRRDTSEATQARVTREKMQREDEKAANKRLMEIRGKLDTNPLKKIQELFPADHDQETINEAVDVLQEEGSGPEHDRAVDTLMTVAKKLQASMGAQGEQIFNAWAEDQGINEADKDSVAIGTFTFEEAA